MYLVGEGELGLGEDHALLEGEEDVVLTEAFPLADEVLQHLAPHGLETCIAFIRSSGSGVPMSQARREEERDSQNRHQRVMCVGATLGAIESR